MGILFDDTNRTFTLNTESSTYQMQVSGIGHILHLYYGASTRGCMDYLVTSADRGFSGNPYDKQDERSYSLDQFPQEYPFWGSGDYRSEALMVRDDRGAWGCDLRYAGYEIENGKYRLEGLPAAHAGEEEAQTLRLKLKDEALGLEVTLLYGVLEKADIITRSVLVRNTGSRRLYLEKVLSASMDFAWGDYDSLIFYGRHAMERTMQRSRVGHGALEIGSRRGMSSHQYNPLLILADHEATEDAGRCWAMQFVYSGGFAGCVEKDQYDQTRMQMGLSPEQFSYPLDPGEMFTAPEVIMSFSAEGLTRLSQNLHAGIRRHILRGPHVGKHRPVLINSWEAAYFDFDADKICALAKEACDLGVSMVVMDDGWFGDRNDDCRALGDWTVNEEKLGCSLGELIRRINDMGMKFGIWIEPEMISENSRLFAEHPDWALAVPGRAPQIARKQMVLDFSRKEVADGIFDQICAVLDQGKVDYVKWDYNRSIMDVWSMDTKDQGRVLYDYMLGVYRFLERLLERYPDLLIEGCSGGGGRFDAGMLYYTPQIWCSDNTDAIDRLWIQYGTSFGYPPDVMGAHVSVSPNEQNGRITPLQTRAAAAMGGTFGYELDPSKLTEEEKEEIRKEIRDYERFAPLVQTGLYYRLTNPMTDLVGAWEIVSEDGSDVLLTAVTVNVHGNMPDSYVRLKGLTKGCFYRNEDTLQCYPADALMDSGMPLPSRKGEYQAYQIHLRRMEG